MELRTAIVGVAAGAHIHRVDGEGNPRELNGPVVVDLLSDDAVSKDASGNVTDDEHDAATTCVADEDVEDIIEGDPSRYYVNVHTADHPSGAIRGQLHAFS